MFKIAGSYQSLDQPGGMNTKTLAATTILALMLTGIATVAYAHPSLGSQTPQTPQSSKASEDSRDNQSDAKGLGWGQILKGSDREKHENHGVRDHGERLNLTVGQTITLTDLSGKYVQIGNRTIRGNASGSFTFTVTGVFKQGIALSITSGTITLGDHTYTVNSGSVQSGPHGKNLVGQGTAGDGVHFLIHATIHRTATTPHGMVMLDLQNGTTEYMVLLRTATSS